MRQLSARVRRLEGRAATAADGPVTHEAMARWTERFAASDDEARAAWEGARGCARRLLGHLLGERCHAGQVCLALWVRGAAGGRPGAAPRAQFMSLLEAGATYQAATGDIFPAAGYGLRELHPAGSGRHAELAAQVWAEARAAGAER